MYSKELNLSKERSGLCPWPLGKSSLSLWNILPGKSVFAYPGALDHTRKSNNVIYGEAFELRGISSTSGGAET